MLHPMTALLGRPLTTPLDLPLLRPPSTNPKYAAAAVRNCESECQASTCHVAYNMSSVFKQSFQLTPVTSNDITRPSTCRTDLQNKLC